MVKNAVEQRLQGVTEEKMESCFKLPEKSAKKLQNMSNLTVDFGKDHKFKVKDNKEAGIQIDGFFRPT